MEEAERCAEKMGFRWMNNTLTDLSFDAFIFRRAVITAVKLKKIRYAIDDNIFMEQKFPDEAREKYRFNRLFFSLD